MFNQNNSVTFKCFNNKKIADIIINHPHEQIFFNLEYLSSVSRTIFDIMHNKNNNIDNEILSITRTIYTNDESGKRRTTSIIPFTSISGEILSVTQIFQDTKQDCEETLKEKINNKKNFDIIEYNVIKKYMIINSHNHLSYASLYIFFNIIDVSFIIPSFITDPLIFFKNYCEKNNISNTDNIYIELIADIIELAEYYDIYSIWLIKSFIKLLHNKFIGIFYIEYIPVSLIDSLEHINKICNPDITRSNFIGVRTLLFNSINMLNIFELIINEDERYIWYHDFGIDNICVNNMHFRGDEIDLKSEIIRSICTFVTNHITFDSKILYNNTLHSNKKINNNYINRILRNLHRLNNPETEIFLIIQLNIYSEELISFKDFIKRFALSFIHVIVFEYYYNELFYSNSSYVPEEIIEINEFTFDYMNMNMIRPNKVNNETMKYVHYMIMKKIYKNIKLNRYGLFEN